MLAISVRAGRMGGFLGVLLLVVAGGREASADDRAFPGDCAAAQDCMNAICASGGGTLTIAPGTHRLGAVEVLVDTSCLPGGAPDPISVSLQNNLGVDCDNVTVRGAGMDQTIIDLDGSLTPQTFVAVNFGAVGVCDTSRFVNLKLMDLTLECRTRGTCATIGAGITATDGVTVERVRVAGFNQGIAIRTSNHVTLLDNVLVGPGTGGQGIIFPGGAFQPASTAFGDPVKSVVTDVRIARNDVSGYANGMRLAAVVDATVIENVVTGGKRGIDVQAARDVVIKNNVLRDQDRDFLAPNLSPGVAAGLWLRSVSSSTFKDNLVCATRLGPSVLFSASDPAHLARYPSFPAVNELDSVKDNRFLGYSPDHCLLGEDGPGVSSDGFCFGGGGGTAGANVIKDNVSDPTGSCP
jgi:hypothetical protein